MKAKELDRLFDEGHDISEYLDLTRAIRPAEQLQRVNVDFPLWVVESLDREAKHLGISRQALIKMWIADRLKTDAS